MPTTSQPSPAEFADVYRKIAKTDPDILSIHISSGLSGTFNSARLAVNEVPEANITLWDSKTLSGGEGWQVAAAAKALDAGWPLERILRALETVRDATNTMFTIARLDYLLHGGRISHIKGLVGSLLNIKPIIEVDKEIGNYQQISSQRTFKKGIRHLSKVIASKLPLGSAIRAQIGHGDNPEGVALLRSSVEADFDVEWLPPTAIAPVLGAHTGPGIVGLAYGPREAYEGLPD